MINEIKKLFGIGNKNTNNENIEYKNKHDYVNSEINNRLIAFNALDNEQPINNLKDDNLYLANKMHLDFQIDKIANENRSLKKQKIVLIIALLCAIIGLTYLGGQSKKEALITMVDDKGQTIKPINLREMTDVEQRDKIIHKIIEESLINIRTVTPDKNLQYELAKKALVNVKKGSSAYKMIIDYLKEDNPVSPYVTGKKNMITPVIKSTINQDVTNGKDNIKRASLLIEWRERVTNLDGVYMQTNEYKGNFVFDIIPPETEEDIQKNPFGIQIYFIQIVPVRIVDKVNDQVPMNDSTNKNKTN
jgi:type IV secretion system protein TrbF